MNTLAAVVLGVAVIARAPRRKENHLFAWFTVSFAVWSFFYLLWHLSSSGSEALFYVRILTTASIFIPVTYFHFVTLLAARDPTNEVRIGYLLAIAFSVLTFSPHFTQGVSEAMMFPYWPEPGPVFYPYLATFIFFVIRAWMVLLGALRSATHWRRRQLTYVCVGSVAGWLGGLTNFFLWFGIPIPPVGNGLALIYIIAVGYAMLRFRLIEVNAFAVRTLVYLAAIALISLIFPITMFFFRTSVPGEILAMANIAEYVGAFLVTLALFFFVPRVIRWVNLFLEEKALGGITGNPHRLREHIHEVSALSPGEMFEKSVRIVSEELKVPQVAIYCRSDYEGDYGLKASTAEDHPFFDGGSLSDGHWLVRITRRSGEALVVYEEDRSTGEAESIAACEEAGVELAIPIYADRVFYGLLLCGRPWENRLYSDLDISLLEALCIQIGLIVRARELERQSNRAEKLISLGTLAAGLAHELRNPLVSIRTFTDLMEEQGLDPEFQRQFCAVVGRDVNRIGAIIDQVGVFAKNSDTDFSPVDLSQVVWDVHDIAREEITQGGVDFVVEEVSLAAVRGNYSQLIQVFLNLVQNAVHALEASPHPMLRITFRVKARKDGGRAVVVTVTDNGPGIPAGIRPRIFDPFVTTKDTGQRDTERGMGLGLGIVKSIVEAHGGSIDVSSTTGGGTAFYVELPCEEGHGGLIAKNPETEKSGRSADIR